MTWFFTWIASRSDNCLDVHPCSWYSLLLQGLGEARLGRFIAKKSSSLGIDLLVDLSRLCCIYWVDIRALLNISSDKTVAVLIASSVTGMIGPAKPGLDTKLSFHLLPQAELTAVIKCDRLEDLIEYRMALFVVFQCL